MASRSANGTIELPARGEHTATVLFLHGLGDTGMGWAPVMQQISKKHIKHSIPVSLNGGMRMPAWFDLFGIGSGKEDEEGVQAATARIHAMLDKEVAAGIPSESIILGGFSQGGATALHAGLTYPKKLAGIIGVSTFTPIRDQLFASIAEANKDTPILMAHGTSDPVVPYDLGKHAVELMEKAELKVELKSYPGIAHGICEEEIQDLDAWMSERLPAKK